MYATYLYVHVPKIIAQANTFLGASSTKTVNTYVYKLMIPPNKRVFFVSP